LGFRGNQTSKNMKRTTKYSGLGLAVSGLMLACGSPAENRAADERVDPNMTALPAEDGFTDMFASGSLAGWEGDADIWRMEDGVLVGEIKPGSELQHNTFLIWTEAEPADFVLRTKFRISEHGNSGINYRSERFAEVPYALKGYQADMDGRHWYTGQNYEERNRTTLAYRGQRTKIPAPSAGNAGESKGNAWSSLIVLDTVASPQQLAEVDKPDADGWHDMLIVAEGNKLSHYVNGKLVSEVLDEDTANRKEKGLIGVQVHVGPPMKVEFRDMRINGR